MILPKKLLELPSGSRNRKIILVFAALENKLRSNFEIDINYFLEILKILVSDENFPPLFRADIQNALVLFQTEKKDNQIRIINRIRRNLEMQTGFAPADWDFTNFDGNLNPESRKIFPDFRVYLEDVRSPFNVGSIFRSADAFGVQEILLSPFTADPDHPRARRTAMGTTKIIPWRRTLPCELSGYGTLVALELGGTELDDFVFPLRGILVVGSEELGISPELLEKCSEKVSISMHGAKASINLGVAFGIVARAWSAFLHKNDSVVFDN